jgi:hypothetical protein
LTRRVSPFSVWFVRTSNIDAVGSVDLVQVHRALLLVVDLLPLLIPSCGPPG